jgi:hypothetical protein
MKMLKSSHRLRVEITVPLEVKDYIEAARHQERLETHFSKISERYDHAQFRLVERRGRGLRPRSRSESAVISGKLNQYC